MVAPAVGPVPIPRARLTVATVVAPMIGTVAAGVSATRPAISPVVPVGVRPVTVVLALARIPATVSASLGLGRKRHRRYNR